MGCGGGGDGKGGCLQSVVSLLFLCVSKGYMSECQKSWSIVNSMIEVHVCMCGRGGGQQF